MIDFAKRFRELRALRGLRQDQMLVSRAHICRLERGTRTHTLAMVERMCECYGIGLQRIFLDDKSFDRLLMLEDSWLLQIVPLVRKLSFEQRAAIVKRLAAVVA